MLPVNENLKETVEPVSESVQCGVEGKTNPFIAWGNLMYDNSQINIEDGMGLNLLYLPSIIPILKKQFKHLRIWIDIMIPIFGYGKHTKLSAAFESIFNKIKNVVFKDIDLPTNLETFIEQRIKSLKGSALIKNNRFLALNETVNDCSFFGDDIINRRIENEDNECSIDHSSLNGFTVRPKVNEIKNAVTHLENENHECTIETDDSILNDTPYYDLIPLEQ